MEPRDRYSTIFQNHLHRFPGMGIRPVPHSPGNPYRQLSVMIFASTRFRDIGKYL